MRFIFLLGLLFCILFVDVLGRSFHSEYDIKLNEISDEYNDNDDQYIKNDLMWSAMERKQKKNNYLINLQENRNEMKIYEQLNHQDMKI